MYYGLEESQKGLTFTCEEGLKNLYANKSSYKYTRFQLFLLYKSDF